MWYGTQHQLLVPQWSAYCGAVLWTDICLARVILDPNRIETEEAHVRSRARAHGHGTCAVTTSQYSFSMESHCHHAA